MAGSADTRVPSILFVTAGFDLPGGIANLSGSVRDALEELRAAGRVRAVRTLSLHDARKPTAARRADATAAGGSRWRFIGTLLWRVMRSRPDLVLFDHVGPARAITLVPGRFRPRYGVMVHGVELEPPVRPSSRSVLIDASLVIANSVYTAQMAERLTDGEIRDRLHVVNPCVGRARVAAWHPHTAPSAAERTPVVLIAGRMEGDQPGKGHEALIAGWPSVVAAIGRARLVVAGDGDKRAKLERMAQDRGVSDSVEFSGYMSADELGSVYRNARVYAMPSRQEGFGIVYAEAMLHGVPCVASTADAASEVVVDGETGLLVPFDDPEATATAILTLLQDDALARRMGEAARRRAGERFTPDALRERLGTVLGLGDAG